MIGTNLKTRSKVNLNKIKLYFDKNVIYSVSKKTWHEFWQLARKANIRGYYSPIAYIEIVSGLFKKFADHRLCFEKIMMADLDILQYSELVIVRHLLSSDGIPEKMIKDEENNYRVFKSTPDYISTYCQTIDDLTKIVVVNKNTCSKNIRRLIENQRELKSALIMVVQTMEGPRYKLKFDLKIIKEFRQRYEERWHNVMKVMYEIVMTDLKQRAIKFGNKKLNRQSIVEFFKSDDFRMIFAEALLDRALGFIYGSEGPYRRIGSISNQKDFIVKIKKFDAFYEFYKSMIIAELTGGSQINDHNDLHQLIYLADGFYFITNDKRLRRMIASSSQNNMVMSLKEALELLHNINNKNGKEVSWN
ncbi:MAG: hypothetical protein WBB67_02770 [bacterium]